MAAAPAGAEAGAGPPHVLSGEIAGDVVRRVLDRALERSRVPGAPRLEEVAFETLYREQLRLARGGAVHASADREFLTALRERFVGGGEVCWEEVLRTIVTRYASEVSGRFDPRVYSLATRVVPRALDSISRAGPGQHAPAIEGGIAIEGEVVALRALASRGSVIVAPTHTSNLDSLVLGLVWYRLGLPPLAYGAGLNLFTNPLTGFFMHHLGAYTVDRKKTDPLYRETLKEYVTTLLERGQHNLVFPGGTRSRSGALESRLKKGLLGTAPVAHRRALEARAPRPAIFVVPCTLSYPVVLEAESLIGDFLRAEGGAHYVDVRRDEFASARRWVDYLRAFGRHGQRVHVRFSRPLDWLGNEVDMDGSSRDARGRRVDPSTYLLVGGRLAADDARDAEYTRQLEAHILSAYRREQVVLSTNLVAFAAFERLFRERKRGDLFRFLRSPLEPLKTAELLAELACAQRELAELEAGGGVRSAAGLTTSPPEELLSRALAAFSAYHPRPVLERRGDEVYVGDAELLIFYRNRLDGYGLRGSRELLRGGRLEGRRGA